MSSVDTILAQSSSAASSAGGNSTQGRRPMNDLPAAQRYQATRAHLMQQAPALAMHLPERWPERAPQVDQQRTIAAMRLAVSTLNEGLLLVGLGDGSALTHLRGDPIGRGKLVQVLILGPEIEAFAHLLGKVDIQALLRELHLSLHLVRSVDELGPVVSRAYNDHAQIARLAGTRVIADHALVPEAESLRTALRPRLSKLIMERYDCLGNDVYDTFLGAKHALMHGDALVKQRRSSDYIGRYVGKSALCIASGPSVAAHFERIRAIQHEHVIICADSILGGLLAHGIEPDFVCMVERPDSMHRLIDEHAPKCRSMMVALPVVHPSSVTPFGDRVVWWWNADDLYPWIDPKEPRLASGRSAGTLTVALAGALGVKTAWLIGHDLAFKDGQSHGSGVAPMALETQSTINRELSRTNPNYYRRIVDAPRNGGGTIETMGVWEIFRSDIEGIVNVHQGRTRFINVNLDDGVGALILGTDAGHLPEVTGETLPKSHPERTANEEAVAAYRERRLRLREEFALVKERFAEFAKELAHWKPLSHTRDEVEAMGRRVDLTTIPSEGNRAWFAYVFRAALRNLMVRLHHNTYVRTMAERNWNQVRIMRLYIQSIPGLIDRLRPELEAALEHQP